MQSQKTQTTLSMARLFTGLAAGLVFSLSAATAWGEKPQSSSKKNLCTLTINSVQEKELFRKHLPKEEFNHIELVPEMAPGLAWIESWNSNSWFRKACEKRVQCDILVVSGHFAGSFFGRSGYSLGLDEMERASCDSSCDGVFKRPKEVYLFGCNTLADKTPDHRSQDDYFQVLRADGLSEEDAMSVAMQRYTPWGASNMDRMKSLFPNAVGLYGFKSTSPLGKNVEPALAKYLKNVGSDYRSRLNQMKKGDRNSGLSSAMAAFSFVQADTSQPTESALVCRLGTANSATTDLIEKELLSATPLSHLGQILQSLREMKRDRPASLVRLRDNLLAQKPKLAEELLAIFKSQELSSQISIRLNVLELQRILFGDDSNESAFSQLYVQLVKAALGKVTAQTQREFCGQSVVNLVHDFSFPAAEVDALASRHVKSKAKTEQLFNALSCLRTEVSLSWITNSYPGYFLYAQMWSLQASELKQMLFASKKTSEQNKILALMMSSGVVDLDAEKVLKKRLSRSNTTIELLDLLSQSARIQEAWQQRLAEQTVVTGDDDVLTAWIEFWRSQRPSAESVQREIYNRALKERDPALVLALFSSTPMHPKLFADVLAGVSRGNGFERSFHLNVLGRISAEGDGLYDVGLQRLSDPDSKVRVEAAQLMLRFFSEVLDPKIETLMFGLLDDPSEDVEGLALRFWAKRETQDEKILQKMFSIWSKEKPDSDLRRTVTDVLQHLRPSSESLISKMESALQKTKNEEAIRQLETMLAAAKWSSVSKDLRFRLIKYFEKRLSAKDVDDRQSARIALLQNTKVSDDRLKLFARDLQKMIDAQNWIGARELAYALEDSRANKDVEKALRFFHKAIETNLEGDL